MTDVVYRREPLTREVEDELEALVRDYYHRTPAKDGIPPYDFDWRLYERAEASRRLILVTARQREDDGGPGKLLGFALYLIYEHPHHRGFRLGDCDTLAVAPEARGRGIGRGLIEYAIPLLKDKRVRRVIHRHRLVYGEDSLFPKLGFRPEEVAYFKDI